MKLSIIIPAYNEAGLIKELIPKIQSARLPDNVSREIIIVNDGSTDDTAKIVEQFLKDPSIKLYHQENLGKSAAVMNGIEKSSGDIILIQDADLEYDPAYYYDLAKPIIDGQYQAVYGSRFMGSVKNMKSRIRLANFMTGWTLNIMHGTKMTDVNTCFKMFKKDVLKNIEIKSSHFGFDTELTVKMVRNGIHIHEIPISYVARTREEGKKIRFLTSFVSYLGIIIYSFKK